jgi:hypothetical protein
MFLLLRMDDNGNRALVAEFPDIAAAELAQAEFESRGHRQIYWVELKEKEPPGGPEALSGAAG